MANSDIKSWRTDMNRPPEPPAAPSHLSRTSQALWDAAMTANKCWSPARHEALAQTLAALDRANQAKGIVDAQGLTVTTESTGAVHLHPAAKCEREFRQQAMRGLEQLGLLHLGGPILTRDAMDS